MNLFRKIVIRLLRESSNLWSDYYYINVLYWLEMNKKLYLKNPQTFTEKLQWLKLYNRKPEYTTMVDKYEVKKYVADIIGDEYIIPTIGVWDSIDEIDLSRLPDKFVLKTTHGGGNCGVVICKDKNKFKIDEAKKKLNKSLKNDIYDNYKEWPYKDVKKRIIAEELIENPADINLKEYKLTLSNGKLIFMKSEECGGGKCLSPDIHISNTDEANANVQFKEIIDIAKRISKDYAEPNIDIYHLPSRNNSDEISIADIDENIERSDSENGKIIKFPYNSGTIIDFKDFVAIIYPSKTTNYLTDYKFFCFNGEPKYCQVISNRDIDEQIDFYDENWVWQKGMVGLNPDAHNSLTPIDCPPHFDIMKQNARALAKGIPFCRVDQYAIGEKVYFGEITFFPASGFGKWHPESMDQKLGEMLLLPNSQEV